MPTITQLQTRIETLKAAIDSGVLRVRHGETETLFRSMDEMNRALTRAEDELFSLQDGTPVRQFRISSRKGL